MPKKEGEELIKWIERRPELDYIRTAANKTLCDYRLDENELSERIVVNNTADKSFGKEGFFQKFLNVIWVPGRKLRGNQVASEELDSSLTTTSKVMSVSTIWDFVCTWPIFTYVLGKLSWASGPAGFLLGFIILWASNLTGENSTNRTGNNSGKAKASLIAFLILSLAKTAVSGVGIDMIISKGRIIEEFAESKILEKSKDEQANLDLAFSGEVGDTPATQAYINFQNQCKELNRQMGTIDQSKGRQRKLYKEIKFQAYDAENAPCKKAAELASKVTENKGKQQNLLDAKRRNAQEKLDDRAKLTSIAYLAKHYREDYFTYFYGTPYKNGVVIREGTGEIIDTRPIDWNDDRKGDAVEASMEQFFEKLQNGELASLGFSIFAFIISIILTSTAAILLYTTGKNREVKASFTSALAKKSNALMETFREDLEDGQ